MVENDNENAANKIGKKMTVISEVEHFNSNRSNNCASNELYLCVSECDNETSNESRCEQSLKLIDNNGRDVLVTDDCSMARSTKNSLAKRRWKILAKALRYRTNERDTSETNNSAIISVAMMGKFFGDDHLTSSVRRFISFDLFQRAASIHLNMDSTDNVTLENSWLVYRLSVVSNDYSVAIHHVNQIFTPDDLIGFNNTGNICVWPSEEALAYYALTRADTFGGKYVLELGGGMTCLAGLVIAKYTKAMFVHLTDGNSVSVNNVKLILQQNNISDSCDVMCSTLKWENAIDEPGAQYDCILSADCLFFDNGRTALVNALWHFMKPKGHGLIMAPNRGHTLASFVQQAQDRGFQCNISTYYNDVIWERHLKLKETSFYDEDIHYPVLIELTKCPRLNS